MGNYWSQQSTITEIENILKDVIFELDVYIRKDGFKAYTLKSEDMRALTDVQYNLQSLSIHLRNNITNNQPIDKIYVDELFVDILPIVEKYPKINDYSIKDKVDQLVPLVKGFF